MDRQPQCHWRVRVVQAGAKRRFRFLVNYYRGFYPYGQFFSEKVESIGFGFYLAF
jgi:hypothetical protein